jgi:hypothetical protein
MTQPRATTRMLEKRRSANSPRIQKKKGPVHLIQAFRGSSWPSKTSHHRLLFREFGPTAQALMQSPFSFNRSNGIPLYLVYEADDLEYIVYRLEADRDHSCMVPWTSLGEYFLTRNCGHRLRSSELLGSSFVFWKILT